METNWNQLIDRYLSGELSEEGQVAFEQMRKENSEFEETYHLHCLAIEGVKRNQQRMVIEQLGKSYHRLRKIKLISFIAALILILGCIGYYLVNRPQNLKESRGQEKSIHLSDRKAKLSEVLNDETQESDVESVHLSSIQQTQIEDSISVESVHTKKRTGNFTVSTSNVMKAKDTAKNQIESKNVLEKSPDSIEKPFKIVNPSEETNIVPEFKISKVYASFPINKKVRKVQVAGKLGAIDSLNNFVIQPMYDSLELIDWNSMLHEKGEREVQIMFSVKSTSFQYAYFYLVKKEQHYYLFDVHFQLITPNGYDKIETSFVYEQLIKVQKNGKYGLITENGKEVVPCIYDQIMYKNGLKGILKGKKVKIEIDEDQVIH